MGFVLQTILNMMFKGDVLPNVGSVPWPLRAFFYIVPMKYVFRTGVYLEFDGLTYAGFEKCTAVPLELRGGMQCWGEYGIDIVESVSRRLFPVLGGEDTFASDVAFILSELVILKFIYMILLICRFR